MDTRAFFHKFERDLMDEQEYLDGVVPNYVPNIGHSRDAASAAGKYVCNTRVNGDGTLDIHVEIPFGCEARVILPRSGQEPQTLPAGSYDFHYMPERDYRKPFDGHTPLATLAESEAAMDVLFRLVPSLGGIAKSGGPEFGYNGLADFRNLLFLHFEPEKLEEAIDQISDLAV